MQPKPKPAILARANFPSEGGGCGHVAAGISGRRPLGRRQEARPEAGGATGGGIGPLRSPPLSPDEAQSYPGPILADTRQILRHFIDIY